MNKVYRIVWNQARGAWMVASELATGRGNGGSARRTRAPRRGARALLLAGALSPWAPVQAESFTALDEITFRDAIADAMAHPDASSIITFPSGGFIISGGSFQPITKMLTIDTGTSAMNIHGAANLVVSGGGSLIFQGTMTSGVALSLTGPGTIAATVRGENTSMTVYEIGFGSLDDDGAITLNIEDGATLTRNSGAFFNTLPLGTSNNGRHVTINVTGEGSTLNIAAASLSVGAHTSANSDARVNITDGGALFSQGALIGHTTGTSGVRSALVSGTDSRWISAGDMNLLQGTLSIQAGGTVTATSGAMGRGPDAPAVLLVDGAHSLYAVTGPQNVGELNGTGRVTLSNGGRMKIDGALRLALTNISVGIVSFGGDEGQAAAAAGTLEAPALTFETGTGRLHFNHTDTGLLFDTDLTGYGTINHVAGTTLFDGDSSAFTGTTNLTGGALRVNGTLGGATSTVSVGNGAVLGGAGTIGGNVTVTDGVIAPGNSPGTLTINGDLTLGADSQLNFELGAAGSADNDLIVVGGDLVLDGTLNISQSAGSAYGAGVYRLIDYTGTLTDNGLEFGLTPAGSVQFLQTSIANQVNLITATGSAMNYWDGDAGTVGDGDIHGGGGTWTAAGDTRWADAAGTINGAFTADAFAVFAGIAGTVTVDDSAGAIGVSGMQFMVDGYRVQGDAIALAAGSNTLRVGDGTADGAVMTATIDAALTGSGHLSKTDLGTLVLTGANSYSGGTTVAGGVLQVASDANLGAASGALTLDGGALRFAGNTDSVRAVAIAAGGGTLDTQANTVTLSGPLSGPGAWTKQGVGTLVLSGANSTSGTATVAAGTLQAGAINAFGPAANYAVTGGALDTNGFDQTIGALTNAGTVAVLGGTLTVTGNYIGNDGVLRLGGDSSAGGRLVLDGGAASGRTLIEVTNLGGLGALTAGNGIEVVGAINGGTTTAQATRDAFALAGGHVAAGAFEYHLHAGDVNGAGESWYLRSTLADDGSSTGAPGATTYRSEVPLYAAVPALLAQSDLTMVSTLHGREGDVVNGAAAQADGHGYRVWARGITRNLDSRQQGAVSPHNDARVHGSQVGVDLLQGPNHRLGLYAGQLDWDSDVEGFAGGVEGRRVGRLSGRSNYLGAYWTYAANAGWYSDVVLQQGWHDGDAKLGREADVEGDSTLLSVEAGKPFALSEHWQLEPQAQVILNHQRLDAQNIPAARLSYDDELATTLRLGARLVGDYVLERDRIQPYARLNLWHGVNGTDAMEVAGPGASTDINSARGYSSLEAAVGATWVWNDHFALYGEAGRWIALDDSRNQEVKGSHSLSVGLRVNW